VFRETTFGKSSFLKTCSTIKLDKINDEKVSILKNIERNPNVSVNILIQKMLKIETLLDKRMTSFWIQKIGKVSPIRIDAFLMTMKGH